MVHRQDVIFVCSILLEPINHLEPKISFVLLDQMSHLKVVKWVITSQIDKLKIIMIVHMEDVESKWTFHQSKRQISQPKQFKKPCFSRSEINTWISCKYKQSQNQKAKERGKKRSEGPPNFMVENLLGYFRNSKGQNIPPITFYVPIHGSDF